MRGVMVLVVAVLGGTAAAGPYSVQHHLKRFTGTWKVQSVTVNGRELPRAERSQNDQVVYDADGGWEQRSEGQTIYQGVVTALDTGARYRAIDFKVVKGGTDAGKTVRAIYEFVDEDTYRVCYKGPGGERPADFSSKEGSGDTVCVLKRQKN